MPRLALLVLLALLGNTLGFLHKSACLIDPISRGHTGEYEHDDEEERREEMFPSGHQHAAMPGGNGRGGHEEDDEEEENHGRGHPVARPVARVQGRSGYRDEDGEWEDARRRRQALSGHRPDLLVGQIACPGHTIHLINVVIGYSNSHLCIQAYEGCQAGSPKATQVLHCQGETGTCQVAIRRVDMPKCGQTVNFAVINYECVPEAKRVNICAPADRDVTDGVVITSPAYPQLPVSTSAVSGSVTSCECTLRAEADSQIVMEYLRSHLPGSGVTCDGDMLVLERPDPKTAGRYVMEREICGHNVSSDVIIHDSILRVTYLGGAPLVGDKSGFIAKFKALSKTGANTVFHISCQEPPTVGANSGKVSGAQAKAIYQQQAGRGESPPAVAGTDAGDSAGTSPGILSGVVASLASVIVIMGSVGAALLHRRRQKKRRELEELERYGTGSQNWYEYGGSTKSDAPYYGNDANAAHSVYGPAHKEPSRLGALVRFFTAGKLEQTSRSPGGAKTCSVYSVPPSDRKLTVTSPPTSTRPVARPPAPPPPPPPAQLTSDDPPKAPPRKKKKTDHGDGDSGVYDNNTNTVGVREADGESLQESQGEESQGEESQGEESQEDEYSTIYDVLTGV